MAAPLKTARAPAQHLLFYAGLAMLGTFCLAFCAMAWGIQPLLPAAMGRTLARSGIGHGFRLYFAITTWLGLTRLELDELDALAGQPPLILAANHPTFLDATLVFSRLGNVGCIMKADVLGNPFLGACARLADFICNDKPRALVRQAVANLNQGSHLLVFPEGTRTSEAPVNDFKPGLALIAKSAGVPVQTVFIENSSPFLSKGWPILQRPPCFPMVYRVRLGRRFDAIDDARLFTRELQHHFEQELAGAELALTDPQFPSEQPVHD